MTPVKIRKRFHVHNMYKSCGNCGMWLYFDEDFFRIEGTFSTVDSGYYHTDYKGCQEATERYEQKRFTGVGKVVVNGQS